MVDRHLPDFSNFNSVVTGLNRMRGRNFRVTLGSAGVRGQGFA